MIKKILSDNAYELLNSSEDSIMVDVRTKEEWHESGIADLQNIIFVTYKPDEEVDFVKKIENNISNKQINILFICRSGVRSSYAAKLIANFGYKNCYNIEDGFEGNRIGQGWINNNLPYKYVR